MWFGGSRLLTFDGVLELEQASWSGGRDKEWTSLSVGDSYRLCFSRKDSRRG